MYGTRIVSVLLRRTQICITWGFRLPEWSPCLNLVRGFHRIVALQFVQNCVYDHLHADLSIISAKSAGIISSLKRAAGTLIGGKWVPTLASVSWWLREAMRQMLVTTFLEKKNGFNATFTITVPLNSSTCIKTWFSAQLQCNQSQGTHNFACNQFYCVRR